MVTNPTGGGNPNFFKTFKGRYHLVPAPGHLVDNDTVMLSCVNDVQFMGDVGFSSYNANTIFATLPTECRPSKIIKLPIIVDTSVSILTVKPDGSMSLGTSHASVVLHLTGISFNISSNWY